LNDNIEDKLNYFISDLDEYLDEVKPLFDLIKIKEKPDIVEKIAASSVLGSFYDGVESSVTLILKSIKEKIPNDAQWHKKLFERMFEKDENNKSLLDNKYKEELKDYLKFRNVAKHIYGSKIDSERLKPLVENVQKLWKKIKIDLNDYLKYTNNKENKKSKKSESKKKRM